MIPKSITNTSFGNTKGLKVQIPLSRSKLMTQSKRIQHALQLFVFGAVSSAVNFIVEYFWTEIRKTFIGQATFRGRDDAFRWILLFLTNHPNFKKAPRAIEVSARPSLTDYRDDNYNSLDGYRHEKDIQGLRNTIQLKESDRTDNQDLNKLGVHYIPANDERIHFIFDGALFWAHRSKRLDDSDRYEKITLHYLSFTSTPLYRLIKHSKQIYQDQTRQRISIHRVDKYGRWRTSSGASKRSADSVHLSGSMKQELLSDAKSFFTQETKQWYNDRGIPYRRGYLLYGPPGSGKSSICHMLASELEAPIYILSLTSTSMSDQNFLERMSEIPSGGIALLEDVDAAFVKRVKPRGEDPSSSTSSQPEAATKKTISEEVPKKTIPPEKKPLNISFSALLNAIDGVGAPEGRLLCITTNHINKLDPALIRPGRVDMRFEFTNATQEQAKELFLRWYRPKEGSELVEFLAEGFGKAVPSDKVSVAALQGFLLSCRDDYQRAAKDIEVWMKKQEKDNPSKNRS